MDEGTRERPAMHLHPRDWKGRSGTIIRGNAYDDSGYNTFCCNSGGSGMADLGVNLEYSGHCAGVIPVSIPGKRGSSVWGSLLCGKGRSSRI